MTAAETTLDPHRALLLTMVLVSASDSNMTPRELTTMGRAVTTLPVFEGFDAAELADATNGCVAILEEEDGLDRAFDLIGAALPEKRLRETAYALACEVAAADGKASEEEIRVLEMVRQRLDIDRLIAAGIERGARARAQKL